MRCATVSEMKRIGKKSRKGTEYVAHQDMPREGTKIREMWDLFKANEGLPIFMTASGADAIRMACLADFYGLDIRHTGKGQYTLVGEWFGNTYVDYLAKRLEEENA